MRTLTVTGQLAITSGGQTGVVAGYCRVSTDSDDQANALVVQVDAVKRAGVDVLIQDVMSGGKADRPGYLKLKQLIATKQVGKVIINNPSRLGRNFVESINFVAMCDEQGIELISLDMPDQPLTLSSSTQMLMTIFPMAIADTYRQDLALKVRKGFVNGRAMGKPMRKPCWGYKLSKDKMRFEPSEHFATAREFINCLIRHDWKMHAAWRVFFADWAAADKPFSSCRGVRAWLLNPTLRGIVAYKQLANHRFTEQIHNQHERLLMDDEFNSFNTIVKMNRKMWGHNAEIKYRPLTSLCVCKECGNKMSYVSGRKYSSVRCKTEGCSQHYKSTREDYIIEAVVPQIIDRAAKSLAMDYSAKAIENPRIKQLELSLSGMQRGVNEIIDIAIEQTEKELAALRVADVQYAYDPEVERVLSDALTWENVILPDHKKLTVVFHEQIEEILIAKQQVASISLKPLAHLLHQ